MKKNIKQILASLAVAISLCIFLNCIFQIASVVIAKEPLNILLIQSILNILACLTAMEVVGLSLKYGFMVECKDKDKDKTYKR
ncbi:MAG: hypothetical protein RSB87_05670 [Clostridia bacterium]